MVSELGSGNLFKCDPKTVFLWLIDYLLGKVLQSTDHLCFVDWTTNFGKWEWKSLWNHLTKEFGMQLKMVLLSQSLKKMDLSLKKPWSQWTDSESKKAKFDCIAKNIITSGLNSDEFFRVSQCKSAKEMWDTLEVIHEGTNEV